MFEYPVRYNKIHRTSGGRRKKPLEYFCIQFVQEVSIYYPVNVRTNYSYKYPYEPTNQDVDSVTFSDVLFVAIAVWIPGGNCQLEPLVEGSGCKRLLTKKG